MLQIKKHTNENFIEEELMLQSDSDFPKRATNISSQITIATYTSNLMDSSNINIKNIVAMPCYTPLPLWETPKPLFDIDYIGMNKDDNINITILTAKINMQEKYQNHLQIYTDGSVLDDNNVGASFVIPELKVERSYYIGSDLSIFTAELTGILLALEYILTLPKVIFKIAMLVDSKSVLQSLDYVKTNTRPDLVYEIFYLLYCLSVKGTVVDFCWVPSHCGIKGNEMADRAARRGAKRSEQSLDFIISKSTNDYYRLLEIAAWERCNTNTNGKKLLKKRFSFALVKGKLLNSNMHYFRRVTSLSFRVRTNSLKIKFSKDVNCICGQRISLSHILYNCQDVRKLLPLSFTSKVLAEENLQDILSDSEVIIDVVEVLLHSPIANLL